MLTLFDQEEVMDIYLYNAVADVPHLYRWRGPCTSDRVERISPPASKHLGKKMPSAFSLNSLGVIMMNGAVLRDGSFFAPKICRDKCHFKNSLFIMTKFSCNKS